MNAFATASLSGLIAFILSPIRSNLASSQRSNSFSAFSFPSSAAFSSSAMISLYLAFAFLSFFIKTFSKSSFLYFLLVVSTPPKHPVKVAAKKSLVIFFYLCTSKGFNISFILSALLFFRF